VSQVSGFVLVKKVILPSAIGFPTAVVVSLGKVSVPKG
jgi:hypothetical protein